MRPDLDGSPPPNLQTMTAMSRTARAEDAHRPRDLRAAGGLGDRGRGATSASRPARPRLSHPAFGLALVALLANDHLLKGAGVLPGWLTGKLSDVAGLVVAPWLAAVVSRAATAPRRALAVALAAAPFSVINVWPSAARAFDAAWDGLFGWTGLHAQTVCDPTDLVALLVLPLTWRWIGASARAGAATGAAPQPPTAAGRGLALRWRERALVGVATMACVATSPGPVPGDTFWFGEVFVWNDTRGPLDLRLRWATATRACGSLLGRSDRAFGREAFGAPITVRLAAGQTLPIDREGVRGAVSLGTDFTLEPAGDCDAILLQSDAMEDTVVFVRRGGGGASRTMPEYPDRGELDGAPDVVTLRATATEVRVEGPPDAGALGRLAVRVSPLVERPPPSSCVSRGAPLDWSALDDAPTGAAWRLEGLRSLADRCLALDLAPVEEETATPFTLYACVPRDAVPLSEGGVVQLAHATSTDGAGTRYLELVDVETGAGIAAYANIAGSRDLGDGVSAQLRGVDCEGDRLGCGAFVLPATLEVGWSLGGTPAVERLAPGDRTTLPDGRVLRFMAGRAVLVALPACRPEGAGTLGAFGDVLLTLPALSGRSGGEP